MASGYRLYSPIENDNAASCDYAENDETGENAYDQTFNTFCTIVTDNGEFSQFYLQDLNLNMTITELKIKVCFMLIIIISLIFLFYYLLTYAI